MFWILFFVNMCADFEHTHTEQLLPGFQANTGDVAQSYWADGYNVVCQEIVPVQNSP